MKLIGKMIAYILAGALSIVAVGFDLLGRILSFIGVFIVFLFAVGLIGIAISRYWQFLPLLIGLFAACIVVFFGSALIAGMIERCRNRLLGR